MDGSRCDQVVSNPIVTCGDVFFRLGENLKIPVDVSS